uniref:Uncharacterized protein n=1 Tax=Triticum urartu TaxID=4572 RepID=A0A8R7U6Q5_TRIUA
MGEIPPPTRPAPPLLRPRCRAARRRVGARPPRPRARPRARRRLPSPPAPTPQSARVMEGHQTVVGACAAAPHRARACGTSDGQHSRRRRLHNVTMVIVQLCCLQLQRPSPLRFMAYLTRSTANRGASPRAKSLLEKFSLVVSVHHI